MKTNVLNVKQVSCEGITMISCQAKNGDILVSVKSICDGLGVDYQSQLKRIKRDDTLINGVVKMTIPTNGGNQDTNMMIISFLPFFLTGIKSSMVKPQVRNKILEFKLKAKDVLAQAFLPQQQLNTLQPQNVEELLLQTQKAINNKVDNLETDFNQYKQETNIQIEEVKTTVKKLEQSTPIIKTSNINNDVEDKGTNLKLNRKFYISELMRTTPEQFYKLFNDGLLILSKNLNKKYDKTFQMLDSIAKTINENTNKIFKQISIQYNSDSSLDYKTYNIRQNGLIYDITRVKLIPLDSRMKKLYSEILVQQLKLCTC